MKLCKVCNSANNNFFENGRCYVCEDAALETDAMIEKAAILLEKEGADSFSISTKIPKDWLAREERAWDIGMQNAESIKNRINRMISSALSEKAEYVVDGEIRIVFDYRKKTVEVQRNEVFVFGRYLKLVPGLSQSRWICSKCNGKGCSGCNGKGRYYDSVEERIGEPLKKAADADDYVLHASGREDVDATNSAGRIFVMMLKNPKKRKFGLGRISAGEGVEVKDLRFVNRGFVELVTESHFDKAYTADVEFGREIGDRDIEAMESLAGASIAQRTPKRVSHRRANLTRHRKIKRLKVISHGKDHAVISIKAEAGTYIKELISGDEGRTEPSISGILKTDARCTALDVSEIDDGFIDLF